MTIYKLTPDNTVKFRIDYSGKINLHFGNKIHNTKVIVENNAELNRSYLHKNHMLGDRSEAYILEFHPHNNVFAVIFDKNDWRQERGGSYTRKIIEMYCDDNGLHTIWNFHEITLMRGGLLTPSYQIRNEQEALKELKSTDNVMDALMWLGNENYLDFLIKHKQVFKNKGLFEK